MSDSKYNGWANYATWRINLELIDDAVSSGYIFSSASDIEEYVDEAVETNNELATSYADAFTREVDYYEIYRAIKDELRFETPWSGEEGTLSDLAGDCNEDWEEEDVQFILDTADEYDIELSKEDKKHVEDTLEEVQNKD